MNTSPHFFHRLSGFYVATAVVSLPHLWQVPIWVVLFSVSMLGWRFFHERYGWPLGPRIIPLLLALLISAAIYKHYGYLLGRDPGVAFLYALLGLKFIEMRNARDANVAVLLLFILTATALLFSQSLWMGAYVLLSVITISAALVRLNNLGALDLKPSLKLAAKLTLQAIPLMLLIYFLFPRIQGSLWGLPHDARNAKTGLSEIMRPGGITELSQSDAVAFRAEIHGPRPGNEKLYWRGYVFWDTDGRLWSRGAPRRGRLALAARSDAIRYSITLEPTNKRWLFALDLPGTRPPDVGVLAGYVLRRKQPVRERLRYTITSYTRYHTGALPAAARERALQLPASTGPRVLALASKWDEESDGNNMQIAHRALQHFRNQDFVYTLKPPLMQTDPVAAFLFRYKRGFCEHFAASFVTLMRAAGVPSRVVVGYQGGEYNAAGKYFIVRQANAHAWAEIWSPQRGWVRVDPTAAVAPERIEIGIEAIRRLEQQGQTAGRVTPDVLRDIMRQGWVGRGWLRLRQLWDNANLGWYNWTADYNFARQKRFLESLGMGIPNKLGLFLGTIGVFVIFGLLLSWWLLRLKQHRDPVQRYYLLWCQKMARAGVTRLPHEGAISYGHRLGRRYPALRNAAAILIKRYIRLRYQRTQTHSDADQFIAIVKAFPTPGK